MTTDVGLSPPYNSLFTFFGQFFDHGVDQTVKSGGTVFVPLHADDPLITVGPDGIAGTGDEVSPDKAFMVLTRAQNQPGPDGILFDDPLTPVDETADNIQNANNTDTPWVDQSQTYTSHSSHQFFLREYARSGLGGTAGCDRQAARRHRQRRHLDPRLRDCGTAEYVLQRRQRHHRQHLHVGGDQAAGCDRSWACCCRTRT